MRNSMPGKSFSVQLRCPTEPFLAPPEAISSPVGNVRVYSCPSKMKLSLRRFCVGSHLLCFCQDLLQDWKVIFFSCHTVLDPKKLFVPLFVQKLTKSRFIWNLPHILYRYQPQRILFLSTPLLRVCSKLICPCHPASLVLPYEMMMFPHPALR